MLEDAMVAISVNWFTVDWLVLWKSLDNLYHIPAADLSVVVTINGNVLLCLWLRSKKSLNSWKHRHNTSAPSRDSSRPHHERSHEYPAWISRIQRIPPNAQKDGDKLMHLAERHRPQTFESQRYGQKSRRHECNHRSRSPYFQEHQPYMR